MLFRGNAIKQIKNSPEGPNPHTGGSLILGNALIRLK